MVAASVLSCPIKGLHTFAVRDAVKQRVNFSRGVDRYADLMRREQTVYHEHGLQVVNDELVDKSPVGFLL